MFLVPGPLYKVISPRTLSRNTGLLSTLGTKLIVSCRKGFLASDFTTKQKAGTRKSRPWSVRERRYRSEQFATQETRDPNQTRAQQQNAARFGRSARGGRGGARAIERERLRRNG